MAKYHINPETGRANICRAQDGNCPLRTEDNKQLPHFNSKEESRDYIEKTEAKMNKTLSSVSRRKKINAKDVTDLPVGQKMRPKVKELKDKVIAQALAESANHSEKSGIVIQGANPERAKRRHEEAIEFAESRQNVHLAEKLSKSKVLPSGSFTRPDGSRFSTDRMLETRTAIKHVEAEREHLENVMNKIAASPDIKVGDKFSFKNASGSYSATVKEGGFNEKAFTELPENIKKMIVKDETSISIDKAREKLSPAQQKELISGSQVIDYVIGKPREVGQNAVTADTNLGSGSSKEKLQLGIEHMGKLYADAEASFGVKQRDLKKESSEMDSSIKSLAADEGNGNNVFAPARSFSNGAVISYRENISRKKAEEILTKSEIDSISYTRQVPDKDKARSLLTKDQYESIFNARKLSFYVRESK